MTYVEDEASYEYAGLPMVTLPSGARLPVMNATEQALAEDHVHRYNDHNQLVNMSDLGEMDRLIILELLVYRLGHWLLRGKDYNEEEINEKELNQQINAHSTEIRLIKKNLGLDRPARERAKGEGSVAHYWEQLQVRARAFGIMRVQQLDKALELTNELISLIQVHDNATPREREELECRESDIMKWIREVYTPEFQAIDQHFREHDQTYWIRSQ